MMSDSLLLIVELAAKSFIITFKINPANFYMFKVNIRNSIKRCEICSKLAIKTPKRRQWRRTGVFIVNFEHISHLFLVFLLLTFYFLLLTFYLTFYWPFHFNISGEVALS